MGRQKLFLVFFLIIFLIVFFYIPNSAFAHPGSVSSDGCHFCRTNCEKWGWTYNTRHSHSGQTCDPSKGPIDPLYTGSAPSITSPTVVQTPIPTFSPAATPTLTHIPAFSPSPLQSPPPAPEVKGVTTQLVQKQSHPWWLITPITTFLASILGWK